MMRARSISRPPAIWWIAALLAPSTGCDGTCEGADCGGLYPRASLGRFRADQLVAASVDPRAPDGAFAGTEADGYDWAVVGAPNGALIGVPALGEVRRIGFGDDAAQVLVTGATPSDRLGSALSMGPGPSGETRLLVSAPEATGGPLLAYAGTVSIYERVDSALAALGQPDRVLTGAAAGDRGGTSVLACDDLDGDGIPDWAVGSTWASPEGSPPLAGILYLGLSRSLPDDRELSLGTLPFLAGSVAGARLGASASCSASLDGDAIADLVVGAPFADGSDVGLSRDAAGRVEIRVGGEDIGSGAGGGVSLQHEETGAWFGASLAVGDLTGDGVADLVVGAPGVDRPGDGESGLTRDGTTSADADDVAGAVYVFDGVDIRTKLARPELGAQPSPVREIHGEFARGLLGTSVLLGDLDGDGALDLVVGAPGTNLAGDAASTRAGAATVWWGPASEWPEVQFASDAPTTIAADRQYLETGRLLAATPPNEDRPAELLLLTREAAASD